MSKSFSTQQDVNSLRELSSIERQEFVDTKVQGLMLIKRKNGIAQWALRYICPRSAKSQTYRIGSVSEHDLQTARVMAQRVIEREYPLDEVDRMRQSSMLPDESECKVSQRLLLREFVETYYLPYIMSSKRSYKTDISVLNNHILPVLGSKELRIVSPYDVEKMIQIMSSKGLSNATCNRALIITRFIFNCNLKWKTIFIAHNPCLHMKEKVENNKKERFLNSQEISNLKAALKKSKNKFLPHIIQLMILTGCRRGEALQAKIIHFDFGRGDWLVPLPKGGKARHIPLNEVAIQTVKATIAYRSTLSERLQNSDYLFPSPITAEPFRQIHYSWDKVRKEANLQDVRMHDLRHSFASAMVNEGMTLYDVKQILGHTNIKTTERYAHLSNQRLRQAASSVLDFYGEQNWIK